MEIAIELVGAGLSVIKIAKLIRDMVNEVTEGFRKRSIRLSDRIDSLLPVVQLLQDDIFAEKIKALQKDDPRLAEIKVFHKALIELDECVTGANIFIGSLKDKKTSFLKKLLKRRSILSQFQSYSERLDILKDSLQISMVAELVHLKLVSDIVETKSAKFKEESNAAFKNRLEIDSRDNKSDEEMLLTLLPTIPKDLLVEALPYLLMPVYEFMHIVRSVKKKDSITEKQIAEQEKQLQTSVSEPVATLASGFSLDQVKTISSNELQNMEKIGEGFLGITYKGKYMMEDVAIKRLKPDRRANLKEVQADLTTEAKNLKKFDSKHVVRLWGIVTEPADNPMIVFEYMSRGTLRRFLDEIKDSETDFPWEKRMQMSLGGSLGLHRIHNMQPPMLHRAIGSDKFLVDSNWEIKICDVGFAKTRSSAGKSRNSNKKLLSTKYYAPEHLDNNKQKYDDRSEIYGYGIVMWEIATLDIPFEGMNITQQTTFLVDHKKSEPLPEDTPESFVEIIDLCRQNDRWMRPHTREVVTKLQKCIDASD